MSALNLNEFPCFVVVFFFCQVTACLALYIVTLLAIIISFCLRLTVLSRLRYYGYYYYYSDTNARGVRFRQTESSQFPFYSTIGKLTSFDVISLGIAYCIGISHDHLGSVCVWSSCLPKYCSALGSEVHRHSGKSHVLASDPYCHIFFQ